MPTDEPATPSLRQLIENIIDTKLRQLVLGPEPGRVTAYDKTKQRVSAQPLIQRVYYDESDERSLSTKPIVQDVPVLFLGGNSTRITTGLRVGDTVLLIPCGASIARWAVRGGLVDPGEERGSLADMIALAGLHDFAHVPTDAPDTALVLHGADVRLGASTATADDDRVMVKKFLSVLRTALTTGAIFGGADGGATFVGGLVTDLDDALGGSSWTGACAAGVRAKR